MSPDPASSRDGFTSVVPSLDTAVPAQEPAKCALRNQFAVFRAQRGDASLTPDPVLLWGNRPGRLPARLVASLAEQSGLPWVEASVSGGVCIDQIIAQVARQSEAGGENRPLGIALLSDLQTLSPEGAHCLARQLDGTRRMSHVHQGRVISLRARQVFWVGSLQVSAPSRRAREDPRAGEGLSFAVLAVGTSSTDLLAAGVSGSGRRRSEDDHQVARFCALTKSFKSEALILPGTAEDLKEWARADHEPWWPGRPLRTFCSHHGVAFVMGAAAAAALATEAALGGGTLDVMEELLREVMEPVLEAIADPRRPITAVEVTPAAVARTEPPRLIPGPRQALGTDGDTGTPPGTTPSGIERPSRTLNSPPEVRLARAEDLSSILDPDFLPPVP